ncbi:MAG TPA: ABC transporter ATP-binding protein [Actinomycetota bacterium]|nr:ABC transporter ATP-binding protein [Actinomycetota bacterium]
MTQPAVRASGISKRFKLYHERASSLKERVISLRRARYEEFWALKDVSLTVDPGETIGLIGPNGSGKSTLLKVVAGIMRPDTGSVETTGRMASLLELGAGFHPDLTGRENVYLNASILGLTRRETDRYFDDIVAFSELEQFVDMQVKHYSSGMYVRLGFAVAVHVEPEILIVDEVLSVGDEVFQRKCLDRIRMFQKEGRTIVFVTHAVDLVKQICTRAAFLHHGELIEAGPAADVVRTFRETLHGEAHLEAAPMTERGTGEVKIVSVLLRDDEGRERQIFQADEMMDISVEIESQHPVEDPCIGIAIYDERDRHVFGVNSIKRKIDLGTLDGKMRVRFRLNRLPLLEGRYALTVGVHSRDERTAYHWQEKAYAFRCVNVGPDVGPFHIPTEMSVEPL